MGLFIKGLSTWVQSRLDFCPKEQNRVFGYYVLDFFDFLFPVVLKENIWNI